MEYSSLLFISLDKDNRGPSTRVRVYPDPEHTLGRLSLDGSFGFVEVAVVVAVYPKCLSSRVSHMGKSDGISNTEYPLMRVFVRH